MSTLFYLLVIENNLYKCCKAKITLNIVYVYSKVNQDVWYPERDDCREIKDTIQVGEAAKSSGSLRAGLASVCALIRSAGHAAEHTHADGRW